MNIEHRTSNLPVPLVCGEGALTELGARVRELGVRRVLLVTDHGIEAAGHLQPGLESLESAGCEVAVFDEVHENPTERDVQACVVSAEKHGTEAIVGFGGGSSMDAAKGCNFLLTNGGAMADYWGVDKATQEMLPFVAVPTTAGTGSECQRFALISDSQTHRKMACGDIKARARFAILDPALTLTQPPFVAACTGMDAVTHAVETAVTTKKTPASSALSLEAFELLAANIRSIARDPDDLEARSAVQLGASLAGAAIEHSMLGAAHAAANPLTANFGTVHGQAVGNMLPAVVRFNGRDANVAEAYAELLSAGGISLNGESSETLARWLEELLDELSLVRPLSSMGMDAGMIPKLSDEASREWTGTFNPRPVTPEDFARFYEEALG